jgi:chromosome partitioning protein
MEEATPVTGDAYPAPIDPDAPAEGSSPPVPPLETGPPDDRQPVGLIPNHDPDRAEHEARIIALANQKGGVGKTTTAITLGAAIAELGFGVLLVDFDPQGGCAIGLGYEPGSLDLSVYDALLDRSCNVEDVVRKTAVPNLDLLPSNIDLAAAELMLVQEVAREQSLLRVLAPLRVKYDFILIDCPPSLGLLTINALTAADGVVIPVETEYYALRGMTLLMDSIDKVRERLNPRLQIDGILATMYDPRTLHSREVHGRIQEAFGGKLFESVIRKTVRFAEAPVAGEPILSYAPKSLGAAAYRNLAEEVVNRVAPRQSARG